MEHKNNGHEQEYPLYTERIVPSPKVKYRRLIKTVKILLLIIAIGVIYAVADKIVIPVIMDKIAVRNRVVDHIEFTRDEYPDPETQQIEDQRQIKNDYDAIIQSLRSKVSDVQRTVVTVREYVSGHYNDNDSDTPYVSEKIQDDLVKLENNVEGYSTMGLLVGHLNGRYMILTSQTYTAAVEEYAVVVQDSDEYKAELVCSDELTGISIISIYDTQVTDADSQYMKVADLDNSYVLNKGDMVIATGKIYGTSGAIDYGTITNRTVANSIDNNYEIFETNLSCMKDDYGFLFNSDGNVVGISQVNSDSKLKAIGISDLKCMIECMINRQGKMYFGIVAQNVDSELSEKNGIPMGIYISKVDNDSPAYQAGLQPGDIIQGINKMPCYSIQRLNDKIYDSSTGQVINVSIKRKGKSGYFDASYDVSVELR